MGPDSFAGEIHDKGVQGKSRHHLRYVAGMGTVLRDALPLPRAWSS